MTTEPIHIATGKYDWLSALHEVPKDQDLDISDRVLVIMVHEFPGGHKAGHKDLYGEIEYKLQKDGFDTLRFDFRGCGESNGTPWDFTFQTARQDLKAVYDWAKKAGYQSFVIIAEGFGSCIALMEQIENIKAMVLLWPLLDPQSSPCKQHIKDAQKDHDQLFVEINKTRVGKTFLKQLGESDMSTYIKSITVPVLVQHGQKDETVPVTQLDMLREHATASRRVEITTYESGTHGLMQENERNALLQHIGQFLQKYT